MGLELGQAQDYTALAVLEPPRVERGRPPELRRPAYALRHLHRFPLGTQYPEVVRQVPALLRTHPPLSGCTFAVDQTGVGRAVVHMFTDVMRGKVACTFVPITIAVGLTVGVGTGSGLHIPKKELVGILQVLLQNRRLHIASELPDAAVLVRELENFRVKITAAANETFEAWRERAHDDLVLAVALAAWCGEKALPPSVDPPEPPRYTHLRAV